MYYGRFGWRLRHRQAPLYRKQGYLGSVMTDNAHAKEVRIFGLGDHLLGRYAEVGLEALHQNWDFRTRQRRTSTLLSLVSTAAASGAFLYIVLQAARGQVTLGDLTLYGAAVGQAQSSLGGLLGSITSVYETNLQVDDLFQFLDYRPRIVSGPRRLAVPVPLRHGLEFRDVSFSYPPSSENASNGARGAASAPLGPGGGPFFPTPRSSMASRRANGRAAPRTGWNGAARPAGAPRRPGRSDEPGEARESGEQGRDRCSRA
jgi:ATP-binding cassette subfamily B protein